MIKSHSGMGGDVGCPHRVELGHPGRRQAAAATWRSPDTDGALLVDDHQAEHHAGERRVCGGGAIGATWPFAAIPGPPR
jgi:hypothetical protein